MIQVSHFKSSLLFLLLIVLVFSGCGSRKRAAIAREKKKCVYEDVRFIGTFVGLREGIAQFERLKGGMEIIVIDSVKVTGALNRDAMVRVRVRRSQGGVCGPTTGEIVRL
jgi:hypothetical protein